MPAVTAPSDPGRQRRRSRCILAAALALVVAQPMGSAQDPVNVAGTAVGADATSLPTLRRLIEHFDFEEGAGNPHDMPRQFHRLIDGGRGFTTFGQHQYANDAAASGEWSFRLDLDGGSMAIRVREGLLDVMPYADYIVSCRVRTLGLRHARARVVASFYDSHGQIIEESIVACPPRKTDGDWETMFVMLDGRWRTAASVAFELQAAQPDEYGRTAANPDLRLPEDVSGHVWFDDVKIWHLPRVDLATSGGSNLIQPGDPVALSLRVRDLTTEHLEAAIEVHDLDGRVVFSDRSEAPRGDHPKIIAMPSLSPGWYRATVTVENSSGIGGVETVDFAILGEQQRPGRDGLTSLGVIIPETSGSSLPHIPGAVQAVLVDEACIPIWERLERYSTEPERIQRLSSCIEGILSDRVRLTFTLHGAPLSLTEQIGIDPEQLLDLVGLEATVWRPSLMEMLSRYGLDVHRWHLGEPRRGDLVMEPVASDRFAAFRDAIEVAVPQPEVVGAISGLELDSPAGVADSYTIIVPDSIPPSSLPVYASSWMQSGRAPLVVFDRLDPTRFTARQQIQDLMLRSLWALRAGLPRLAIDAPWRDLGGGAQLEPDPLLPTWRVLNDQLVGRQFAGEFELAPGVRCWILAGSDAADTALVVWTDQFRDSPIEVDAVLAAGAVSATNHAGEIAVVPMMDGQHRLAVDSTPMFIEGVSLELARFRRAIMVVPDFIEAVHRRHEAEIVVRNTWPMSISGRITLGADERWEIAPRLLTFDLAPGAEIRMPIEITLNRGALSGAQDLNAIVEVVGDEEYRFTMPLSIGIGIRDVELTATWHVARNVQTGNMDLIVSQTVHNATDRYLALDLYAMGPGISRQRRPVTSLAPGASATRTFRIDDGASILAGSTLRVGASDRDGRGRITRAVAIPASLRQSSP